MLKIENLDKYYGSGGNITKALNHVSFEVQDGEFLGIMGASGSGKTTLLNTIATIHRATAGHIWLDGADITELKSKELAQFRMEHLGFVFQDFNLLDNFTLGENIGLALSLRGERAESVSEKVKEAAEQLGIGDILDKMPTEVSGGQRQRCACARAVINHPSLLLADEPTGNLDSKSGSEVMEMLCGIRARMNKTLVVITHDPCIAKMADRKFTIIDGVLSEVKE